MTTLVELWKENEDFFNDKELSQIIGITGDGELRDGNNTSKEIREFLNEISSYRLIQFGNDCLSEKFKDSGFALQDVINEYGRRLGFEINHGLYRGKRDNIGYDGIWKVKDGYSFVIEVKTTDAYRINLNTLAKYRDLLIDQSVIDKNNSSILIVVGRQDTGDLEAQIRGSRYSWNIRLISIDALTKLLDLRETVSDNRILQQINEILKPLEYTRLDSLIDLIFQTSHDVQIEEESIREVDHDNIDGKDISKIKITPVNYHDACIERVSKFFGKSFLRQSKTTFESSDNQIGLTCAVSKIYFTKHSELFWYAFHPYQRDYLLTFDNGFVSFGCGDDKNIILIPVKRFIDFTNYMNRTDSGSRYYYHVKIHKKEQCFELEQPLNKDYKRISITEFL